MKHQKKARSEKAERLECNRKARLQFLKQACECCGIKNTKTERRNSGLHVHHKDRNWRNNTAENIQTLCLKCHMDLHRREDGLTLGGTEKFPCRICGKPYHRNSRGDLCSTHRDNMQRLGVPVPPERIHVPCIICGAPWEPLKSRGDHCNAHRLCKKRYPLKYAALLKHVSS